MYFAFMNRDRFNRKPPIPVRLEAAPGRTMEEKLQALLTSPMIGEALAGIVDEANEQAAEQDRFSIEELPQKLRTLVEERGGEVRLETIYWELFGIGDPTDAQDYRTKSISLALAWVCDAGILERRMKRDMGQGNEYEVLGIPTPPKPKDTQGQKDPYDRWLHTRSTDTYERDGYIYDSLGYKIGKAPEPIDPNTAAALKLIDELRNMPIRPRKRNRGGRRS